jgi:hypothetical protein
MLRCCIYFTLAKTFDILDISQQDRLLISVDSLHSHDQVGHHPSAHSARGSVKAVHQLVMWDVDGQARCFTDWWSSQRHLARRIAHRV